MVEPIVAIGFLTESDLRRLGDSFRRHFPIDDTDKFEDLLEKLNQVPSVPTGSDGHGEKVDQSPWSDLDPTIDTKSHTSRETIRKQ